MLRQKRAREARTSFGAFAWHLRQPGYDFNWHHWLYFRKLDAFARGRIRRMIVQMPPGHGKSEGCSRLLPAWLFGQNPDARVMACSYTASLAREMNRDVQRIIDTERYRFVFPTLRLPERNIRTLAGAARRNADIFDIPGHRGVYLCAGVGGSITGRRFDVGIIDDPVKDREAADSPVQREAVWRWYTSTFSTRAAKGARILIACTRWHEDDLVGRLLAKAAESPTHEQWEVLSLPAISTDLRHPDDPRRPGAALWPWFQPLDALRRKESEDVRDFAALYQQDPRAGGDVEWPPSYFGPGIWFDDWPRDLTCKISFLDPSKGKEAKHRDFSAIVSLGRSHDGTLWCEADLRRRNAEQIVEDCIEQQRVFAADKFGVESNVFQELLATQLATTSRARGIMVPVEPVVNTVNKQVRIRRLGPYLAKGAIRFRATPGTRLLVQQLKDFPLGMHDDGPDALEGCLRLMIAFWNGRHGRGPQRLRAT